jgi:hypothetical protein
MSENLEKERQGTLAHLARSRPMLTVGCGSCCACGLRSPPTIVALAPGAPTHAATCGVVGFSATAVMFTPKLDLYALIFHVCHVC